ncbi:hypothetical protein JCM6882_006138 [Rhodosporidiobolus microsporus]
MLLHSTLFALALASAAVAAPSPNSSGSSASSPVLHDGAPIVDLGKYGKYKGTVQNNGTVHSWKAIPYAAPPIGDLRFKGPRPLPKQNSTVQDVSDDFESTACVQFSTTTFTGINAGPGQEDCLKLWVWAPAGAKKGDKLPVRVYTHGGAMQNRQSTNYDPSDWVGQDQGFVAVNANYRLGLLANWNSEGALWEGETANVGVLDARFAVDWVKANIAAFGGDPKNIAVDGQSGGGGMIMSQLVLYDGKKPNYHKAIARSIQDYPAFTLKELTPRNDAFAALVNCTDSAATKEGAKKQLACMRKVPAETIRLVSLDFEKMKQENGFSWPRWLPAVDGKTLTDGPIRLLKQNKIAQVPIMTGSPTNDFGGLIPSPDGNFSSLVPSILEIGHNVSLPLFEEFARIYPAPSINASENTNTYANTDNRAWDWASDLNFRAASVEVALAAVRSKQPSYFFRFDAPNLYGKWPAHFGAAHGADNSYLFNATSTMNATEQAIAYEWRAYLSSFVKHSDPNVERLDSAVEWQQASTSFRCLPRLAIAQQLGASANLSLPTGTAMEITPSNQYDRLMWLNSDAVLNETRH